MILSDQLLVDTTDFVVEHLTGSAEDSRSLVSFSAGRNARGLENYLKHMSLKDEMSNECRTYLVRDSMSRELACYFSLRTCLVPIQVKPDSIVTIPSVELANFAVNENYRRAQRATQKIGAYVFLKFILPIVKCASDIVGAKWLCIYALPAEKLIKYYAGLGFQRLTKDQEDFVYSHVKPEYDAHCIFMWQDIRRLTKSLPR